MWLNYGFEGEEIILDYMDRCALQTKRSKKEVRAQDTMMLEAESGVMHFEDGGETANQGLCMVTRCLKKQKGNRFCLQGFQKKQALPKPRLEPSEIFNFWPPQSLEKTFVLSYTATFVVVIHYSGNRKWM